MIKSFFSFFDLPGTVSFITYCVFFMFGFFSDSSCLSTILRETWITLIRTVVLLAASQIKKISCLIKLHLLPFSIVALNLKILSEGFTWLLCFS
ncbi:hypothetical protein Bca101_086441 [Brassica carinata]